MNSLLGPLLLLLLVAVAPLTLVRARDRALALVPTRTAGSMDKLLLSGVIPVAPGSSPQQVVLMEEGNSVGALCPMGQQRIAMSSGVTRCAPMAVLPTYLLRQPRTHNPEAWDALYPGYNPVLPPPIMPGQSPEAAQPAIAVTPYTMQQIEAEMKKQGKR